MDLRQLQYFLTCAEKGSLTRAAEELYTTQPHVSQVIRALERELNVRLFRRTGTGIALTEEGEQILLYAQSAWKNAELIREVCEDRSGETLRIAVNSSSRLASLTEDFFCGGAAEGLRLRYSECGIETMMELLQNRRYDLGFLFVPTNKLAAFSHMAARRHLRYTQLLLRDLVVYCGPEGPFYGRASVRPEELDGCGCIQAEDDYFSVEELLTQHPAFRSGKWAIRKLVCTNSDHLMLDFLRKTALCNIGSYWVRGAHGTPDGFSTTAAAVEGFEHMVSFGYLQIDNREARPCAERFLAALTEEIRRSGEDGK